MKPSTLRDIEIKFACRTESNKPARLEAELCTPRGHLFQASISEEMACPAAPHTALENPFDDIHAFESPRQTFNPPSARAQAVGHGGIEASGVWSRRFRSILMKTYDVLHPPHVRGSQHRRMVPVYGTCLLVACFCVALSVLTSSGSLVYIPIGLFGGALFSTLISEWVVDYLTMPLCILSFVAVFAVTMMSYFADIPDVRQQHLPLIIIMSIWCAFIPVICFLGWSFWRPRMGGIRRGIWQSVQGPPSQTAIELTRLPREPRPAVLSEHHVSLSTDHNRVAWQSRPAPIANDDGFQRVREFF